MAVLEKRAGINLSSCDAYVNIAGGIKMNEPAIDLGIVLAIVSSQKDVPISDKVVAFGEVGLSGEVRAVSMAEQRVQECRKLGFEKVIVPEACRSALKDVKGIEICPVENVRSALRVLRIL